MPIVAMPDGTQVNFPDTMSREEIRGMIATKFPEAVPTSPQAEMPEPQEGLGRTVLEKGLQGATFGFADELTNRLGAGMASMFTDENYNSLLQEAKNMAQARGQRQSEQRPVASALSEIGGSLLTGGAAGTTKAGGALAKGIASGGLPARIAKGAAAGAATGGLYGAGTAEEGQRLEGAKEAATTGAALGGVLPAAGEAVRGVVLPKVSEALQPLAQRAKEFNIPLSIDQVAPSKFRGTVKKISQQIPFSGVDKFEDTQRQAFNKAVAKTIGQDADDLSPKVIKAFKKDAEKKFGNALIGKDIQIIPGDIKAIENIANEAESALGGNLLPIVKKNVEDALRAVQEKDLKGAKLTSIRSSLIKRIPRAEGESKEYLGDIVEAIDDIAERHVSQKDLAVLRQARREWRNYKTIEPLLEKAEAGQINPTQLSNRVAQSKFIKAAESEVGQDDLVDLGRIGKSLLPKLGGSDTYEKAALTTSLIGSAFSPETGALLGGGMAANRLMQELNRLSPRVAKAVEKGGKRFIPESLMPALLAGLAASGLNNEGMQEEK